MKRADLLNIGILMGIVLLLFYPLFYTTYLYSDESLQLWLYKEGTGFHMFVPQGRYLTDRLCVWLYGSAHTAHQVTAIRLFSLFGWLVCLPVWYAVLHAVTAREGLPRLLPFFSVLYLVAMPSFSVSVSWAACLELFIANTSGLLSGYVLYRILRAERPGLKAWVPGLLLSLVLGLVSLFTYQNGVGCFLLPFLLQLVARPEKFRPLLIAIGVYGLLFLVYYLLFRYNLKVHGLEANDRTGLYIAPWGKLIFLFTRPLAAAFHFTYLFNERSIAGVVVYGLLFCIWVAATLYCYRALSFNRRVQLLAMVCLVFVLAYLPSLAVRENYASNRTLPALRMAVFLVTATTLLMLVRKEAVRRAVVVALSVLFVANAVYNFRVLFLAPVKTEYDRVRAYIEANYRPGMRTVYFIRPEEDLFVRRYGITRVWDEFGVPSTFFGWVPLYFVRQVVYEKTGSRRWADEVNVTTLLRSQPDTSVRPVPYDLVVDVEKILAPEKEDPAYSTVR